MTGWAAAIFGTLVTAAVSTLGDYLWANVIPHHRPIYGLTHGALLFLTVGWCLGRPARKGAIGAVGGAFVGVLAAGGFYLTQPLIGYSGLFVFWIALWVALGLFNERALQRRGDVGQALIRSGLAAVGSGVAFYAISGIWFPFNPHGWDYVSHLGRWTIAYLPAFFALLVGQRPK